MTQAKPVLFSKLPIEGKFQFPSSDDSSNPSGAVCQKLGAIGVEGNCIIKSGHPGNEQIIYAMIVTDGYVFPYQE